MKQIYPITTIDNVIDDNTNINLREILNLFNHINLGNQATINAARICVPNALRKRGLYVTYIVAGTIYTDIFIGNEYDTDDDSFVKQCYWRNTRAINCSNDESDLIPVMVDSSSVE